MKIQPRYAPLAVALSLALTACGGGGGGGGVKDTPPPPAPPAPAVCEDNNAENKGDPLPCVYRYNGRADNVLVPARVDLAHQAGFTGEGVKVGVLDDALAEDYAPLDGRISWSQDYTDGDPEPGTNEKRGHGTVVSTVLGGTAGGSFNGGVAPDAELFYGRICYDDSCSYSRAQSAIRDMVSQGVRLFNFSIGSVYDTEEATRTAALNSSYSLRDILSSDGLMVMSAGNSSKADPTSVSLIPHYDDRFADNWLVAMAVDVDSKGNISGKSEYSNACGRAADWCLAAPGLVEFPSITGSGFSGGAGQGTSFAAPIITGTAALVWEAFPWMSAKNVQQTLLTTATDLGDPGVDAVFGWGLVNAEKAVRGPGQFVDDFAADVTSGSFTFANDISGAGGILKTGDGSLILAGNNTYRGLTDAADGELVLHNGARGSVRVGDGATLTAGGRIGGNFTASADATTAIAVGDALAVAGKASLDGTLKILAGASDYTVGATETLMEFGSREGEFADVTYGSGFFYTATLGYSDESLTANLTRTSSASAAKASGASARVIDGGRQADALFGFTDTLARGAGRDQLLRAAGMLASAQTAELAEASLASLTGEVHGTARGVAIQQAVNTDQLLGDRVATLDPAKAGVWFAASTVDGAFERSGFADADYRQSSVTLGVDRSFGGDLIAGLALTTGDNRADLDALDGDFDADADTISAYARMGLTGGYLSATASHTRSTVETDRNLLLGTDVVNASARHKDTSWSARIEGGRGFGQFTPFLAGGWVRHEQGSFREVGGEGLGLAAASDTAEVYYGELGVRFANTWDRLTLRAVLAGRWAGGDTTPTYGAWFNGAPEAAFTVTGQRVPGRAGRAGVGVEFASSPNVMWGFDIGGEKASGSADSAYASGSVRIVF